MDLPHGKVRAIYGTADEITEFIEQLFQEKSLLGIKWNDKCTLSFFMRIYEPFGQKVAFIKFKHVLEYQLRQNRIIFIKSKSWA